MRSRFGQLTSLFNTLNMGIHAGVQAGIQRQKTSAEERLAKEEIASKERLSTMGLEFRDKELANNMAISLRRDKLFKDIALYAGISVGAIAIIITLGVIFISIMREEKYEYVEEV